MIVRIKVFSSDPKHEYQNKCCLILILNRNMILRIKASTIRTKQCELKTIISNLYQINNLFKHLVFK